MSHQEDKISRRRYKYEKICQLETKKIIANTQGNFENKVKKDPITMCQYKSRAKIYITARF